MSPCLCRDMAFCKTPAIAFRLPGCGARPGLMGILGKDHSPENGTQIHTKPCIRVQGCRVNIPLGGGLTRMSILTDDAHPIRRCRDQPARRLSHRDEQGRVVFQTRRGGDMDITQPAAQFVKDRLPVGIEDIVGDGHLPPT